MILTALYVYFRLGRIRQEGLPAGSTPKLGVVGGAGYSKQRPWEIPACLSFAFSDSLTLSESVRDWSLSTFKIRQAIPWQRPGDTKMKRPRPCSLGLQSTEIDGHKNNLLEHSDLNKC